mmetsp:Transcript_36252/g.82618  ORF Transcript_36252/g.82618 Transcript_36252/m.82618 type:complete len:258 (+) Transcript_36252:15-788(+)|eukprot:CAMPEP_0114563844 /NCGR_PEP_ID=MMETSP0114-20121206/13356_1 /TAXON_ID=31324 /ORGANISM="Goniomonas sp, Strain m" /LENGTH=257 /DNA_ID=CAMNT_0001749777 /DNA_START=15 /DNA_END=788 /DNA_ORIENTATION=+
MRAWSVRALLLAVLACSCQSATLDDDRGVSIELVEEKFDTVSLRAEKTVTGGGEVTGGLLLSSINGKTTMASGWAFVAKTCFGRGSRTNWHMQVRTVGLNTASAPELLIYFEEQWFDAVYHNGDCSMRPPTYFRKYDMKGLNANRTFVITTDGNKDLEVYFALQDCSKASGVVFEVELGAGFVCGASGLVDRSMQCLSETGMGCKTVINTAPTREELFFVYTGASGGMLVVVLSVVLYAVLFVLYLVLRKYGPSLEW